MQHSVWRLGGLSWRDFGWRLWNKILQADLFGKSAQLAYYFLFSIFPLLICIFSILGILLGANIEWQKDLYHYFSLILPNEAFELLKTVLQQISETGGTNLSFGLILALFAASGGIEALMSIINQIYKFEDKRSFWYRRLLALGLTLMLGFLILIPLLLILAGSEIIDFIALHFSYSLFFTIVWRGLRWLIILGFLLIAFASVYYWSPDAKNRRWFWITPGSIVGVILWLLISFAFRQYLEHFNTYNKTYGSLGAVIILLFWLYLTGLAILLGAQINAELEAAVAEGEKSKIMHN